MTGRDYAVEGTLRAGPVAAMRWRRRGGGWRVEHVGATISDLCGWSAADFANGTINWLDIAPEAPGPDVIATAATLADTVTYRYAMRRRDGAERRILEQVEVDRDPDGVPQEFTSVLIDVTDAAREMGGIGRLAYVSHEVRTPLTGILGLAETLAQSPLTEEQRDAVRALSDAGAALMSLVNSMLELSRLEAGADRPEPCVFRLGELCRSIERLYVRRALERGLSLRVQGCAVDLSLWADAAKLRQIVTNLVANALKFTPAGEVVIEWSLGPPDAAGGMIARVTVRDTGSGMDAATLAHVFAPYAQSPAGAAAGGTGLGLTIAQELARVLGGRLWAESAPGEGAAFHLEAPVRAATAEEADDCRLAHAEARRRIAQRRPRLLVAEDADASQHLLRLLLTPLGAQVTFVGDGAEAVRLVGATPVDAVLMDCRMPRLGGVEATRRIRADELARGAARTPILALSADLEEAVVADFLAAGADAHLAKPFTAAQLFTTLAGLLVSTPSQPTHLRLVGG